MRGAATASVELTNATGAPWQLRPVIQNDFWSGPDFVRVRAVAPRNAWHAVLPWVAPRAASRANGRTRTSASGAAPRPLTPPLTHTPPAQVPANGSAEYPLTYRPLTMSRAGAPHEGSLFFPIPDGSGLLYRLLGTVGHAGSLWLTLSALRLPPARACACLSIARAAAGGGSQARSRFGARTLRIIIAAPRRRARRALRPSRPHPRP